MKTLAKGSLFAIGAISIAVFLSLSGFLLYAALPKETLEVCLVDENFEGNSVAWANHQISNPWAVATLEDKMIAASVGGCETEFMLKVGTNWIRNSYDDEFERQHAGDEPVSRVIENGGKYYRIGFPFVL